MIWLLCVFCIVGSELSTENETTKQKKVWRFWALVYFNSHAFRSHLIGGDAQCPPLQVRVTEPGARARPAVRPMPVPVHRTRRYARRARVHTRHIRRGAPRVLRARLQSLLQGCRFRLIVFSRYFVPPPHSGAQRFVQLRFSDSP